MTAFKSTKKIRNTFIEFFKENDFINKDSASVLPQDDPNLLFLNSGMVPFKRFFLREALPEHTKCSSIQRCIRAGGKHNDLDQVGYTKRHMTSFEMCGFFIFPDAFTSSEETKLYAIQMAYKYLIEILELDKDKIHATVYKGDPLSAEIWKKFLPGERIHLFEASSNFWQMGEFGPCGPCTEILYDRGSEYGSDDIYDEENERFLEIWNLVFMDREIKPDGHTTSFETIMIDTGAGLERLAMIIQKKNSVFEIDLFEHLITTILRDVQDPDKEQLSAAQAIADHIRTIIWTITDGIQPSNTAAGYVIRKILRRAHHLGQEKLGKEDTFLSKLTSLFIQHFEEEEERTFPTNNILRIVKEEEQLFCKTIKKGAKILHKILQKQTSSIVSGNIVFLLKDTYGLPLEDIIHILDLYNLTYDAAAYHQLESEAKILSKKKGSVTTLPSEEDLQNIKGSLFDYDQSTKETDVVALFDHKGSLVASLQTGENGLIIFQSTIFSPTQGGQKHDTGLIEQGNNNSAFVYAVHKYHDIIIHAISVQSGSINSHSSTTLFLDAERRDGIERAHSAIHLLHHVLQQKYGENVKQAGSLVEMDRFHLDFSLPFAMSNDDIIDVCKDVTGLINKEIPTSTCWKTYKQVVNEKDIQQLFQEKYADEVRIVSIGPSQELCIGTHVNNSAEIKAFLILSEGAVSAGTRRIEAVTGEKAIQQLHEAYNTLSTIVKKIPGRMDDAPMQVEKLLTNMKELERELTSLKGEYIQQSVKNILSDQDRNQDIVHIEATSSLYTDKKLLIMLSQAIVGQMNNPCFLILSHRSKNSLQLAINKAKSMNSKMDIKTLLLHLQKEFDGKGGGNANQGYMVFPNHTDITQLKEMIDDLLEQKERCS